ncbi:MAG: hypothetical protein ACOCTN_06555 [Candidatus Natronoplasma sp.]
MLDRDSVLMGISKSRFDDERSDFHTCLKQVKELSRSDEEFKEHDEFMESVDRYLHILRTDE